MPGWNGNFPYFTPLVNQKFNLACSEKLWKSNSDPQKKISADIWGHFSFPKTADKFCNLIIYWKICTLQFFPPWWSISDTREKKPVCSNMCNLIWIVAADIECADFQFFMWPKILSRFRPFFSTSLMLWSYFALQCCLYGALYRQSGGSNW